MEALYFSGDETWPRGYDDLTSVTQTQLSELELQTLPLCIAAPKLFIIAEACLF